MALISQRTIAAVHDLNIVDVVEHYGLQLKRSGSNYTCCCPFHNERTPSFSVSKRLNLAHCFSCGKSVGPVQFVMEQQGLEYRQAVEELAKAFGIPVEYEKDERTDADIAAEKKRESMRAILTLAQNFFSEQFLSDSPEAQAARAYAYSRWDEEYCKQFGIGYAPRDSAVFIDYMKKQGADIGLLLELGLLGRNKENGNLYSMFRQRVTLPVRSRTRSMVTFSARYIGNNPDIMKRSKYMNLTDSPLFNKSETLFGIDVAAKAARECGHFVVVEGGPDVMRLQIIGVLQAVAPMGTALTAKHLAQMKRVCGSICFIPDSDAPKGKLYGAGVSAVMKNGKLALANGFDVSVRELPCSEEDDENDVKRDADSFITSLEVYNSLESAPFIVWYAQKRLKGADTSELQAEVISEVAELMLYISDENLREMYLDRLSKLVGKMKMWRDAVKRAGRRVKEAENVKADCDGIKPEILASLRRRSIIPKNGCYCVPDDDGNLNRCSNFLMFPVLHIKGSDCSTRILRILNERSEEDVLELTSGEIVNLRDFNKALIDRGNFFWRGDAKALTALQEHLVEVTPSASLIEILGWNPKLRFYAFSNGIYADGKFYPTDKLGVVSYDRYFYYLPAFSEIHADNEKGYSFERLFRCVPTGAATLHEFVELLVGAYGTGAMVSFAWTIACIFRDIIFERFKNFPVLNLFGRKGSGKTELARALSSLFYVLPESPHSISNTTIPVIGYILSHARNSLIILDEYMNDMKDIRIDLLKGLWGGTARSKMDNGIPLTIPVLSGVILAGQYKPEDEAIFSRCIHLMYSETVFSDDKKRAYKKLKPLMDRGNMHMLLQLLNLRDIFEKGFFQAFDLTKNDVLVKLKEDRIEERILNNWLVALAAFRVIEPHIDVPFTYNDLFEAIVNGIRYQNDQIKKSSDTANFWLDLDSLHTAGKVKEKCHFVIKSLPSFAPLKGERRNFVEPKRIIFLNFKAVRGLMEIRYKQKGGVTLDMSTLESYLKSLPQYLGMKQQRFQILRNNGELDEEYKSDGSGQSKKYVNSNQAYALCFDYDSLQHTLDLNLETVRLTEDELDADPEETPAATDNAPFGAPSEEQGELPF
ncbi:DNA primase [Duncaniella dubosii]|uniref:DNA primase n=1 Tax=Duncaniella dubosii TaxID=2518971 RepID=UPI0023F37A19|nr:DNA primase [Duncaniella dubosii]MCX4285183.1 DNA primase [Duncaniella dubosii]